MSVLKDRSERFTFPAFFLQIFTNKLISRIFCVFNKWEKLLKMVPPPLSLTQTPGTDILSFLPIILLLSVNANINVYPINPHTQNEESHNKFGCAYMCRGGVRNKIVVVF